MMDLFLYLHNTNPREVGEFLGTFCQHFVLGENTKRENHSWTLVNGGNTDLYISVSRFPKPCDCEEDEERVQQIVENLGYQPTVVLNVQVSGNRTCDGVVFEFVKRMLTRFEGVADDDLTHPWHGWTLAEIKNGTIRQGTPFWGHRGWSQRSSKENRDEATRHLALVESDIPRVEAMLERDVPAYQDLEFWEEFSQKLISLSRLVHGNTYLTSHQKQRYQRIKSQLQHWRPRLSVQGLPLPDLNQI